MIKVNPSVLQCLGTGFSCKSIPTVQIDGRGTGPRGRGYVGAQALTCSNHIEEGKQYMQDHFPNLTTRVINNPGWLRKEQEATRKIAAEGQSTSVLGDSGAKPRPTRGGER